MKKYIFCGITILATFTIKAADTLTHTNTPDTTAKWFRKITFGLNAGIALPMNQYGSKASNNPSDSNKVANGYANTGYHIDITVSYPVYWKLGVTAYAGYNLNSFDATTYETKNGIAAPNTFTAKNYTAWQYLAGPYFAMPIGNKFIVSARAMAGLITINYPRQTINTTSTSTSQWFNYTSFALQTETSTNYKSTQVTGTNGSGFAYQVGLAGQYKLGKKTTLALNADWANSNITYSSVTYNTSTTSNYLNKPNGGTGFGSAGTNGTSTTTSQRKFSSAGMTISLLTVSLGVTYHL